MVNRSLEQELKRPIGTYCKILVEEFKNAGLEDSIRVNNMGPSEGCIIDIKHKGLNKYQDSIQTSSSIHLHERDKYIDVEVMIPHCKTYSRLGEMFLINPDMDLCFPGCDIKQVHTHSYGLPNSHFHVECKIEKFEKQGNPFHCVKQIAWLVKKADDFATKTCSE